MSETRKSVARLLMVATNLAAVAGVVLIVAGKRSHNEAMVRSGLVAIAPAVVVFFLGALCVLWIVCFRLRARRAALDRQVDPGPESEAAR